MSRRRGRRSVGRGRGSRAGLAWAVATAVGVVGMAYFAIHTASTDPVGEARTLPAPDERVRVEILNGGGVPGAARQATELARAAGYDVVYFGNAVSFDYETSEVLDRVSRSDFAEGVAAVLGIDIVRSDPDPDRYVDLSVILGRDWRPPAAEGPLP
jgi:hypothetical protein